MALINSLTSVFGAALLATAALGGAGCNRAEASALVNEQQSQPSPSGKFSASAELEDPKGKPALRVFVKDGQQREVYRSQAAFSTRHRTIITWEEREDRLWIYSGDVGTIVVAKDAQGNWNEVPEKGLTPPPPIRAIYDKLHL